GELRLQGEAVRACRTPAAARAPPRLEGDLLPRRARGAHHPARRVRPGRHLPRALRGDGRSRSARPAPGRGLRHLPRRRPARENGPRVDGAFTRGPRSLPRLGGDELRLRAAREAQGARAFEEGAAAQGGRAIASARGRARAQAGLLDPGGCVAPRRARAVRARDAVTRDPALAGVLPARACDAPARRARRRRGGLEPPALGAALGHALARAPRRAGAAAASVGADGGAARLMTGRRLDGARLGAETPALPALERA